MKTLQVMISPRRHWQPPPQARTRSKRPAAQEAAHAAERARVQRKSLPAFAAAQPVGAGLCLVWWFPHAASGSRCAAVPRGKATNAGASATPIGVAHRPPINARQAMAHLGSCLKLSLRGAGQGAEPEHLAEFSVRAPLPHPRPGSLACQSAARKRRPPPAGPRCARGTRRWPGRVQIGWGAHLRGWRTRRCCL